MVFDLEKYKKYDMMIYQILCRWDEVKDHKYIRKVKMWLGSWIFHSWHLERLKKKRKIIRLDNVKSEAMVR